MATTEERLTVLETDYKHASTKADLHALETRLIKWIVGAFLGGMVAAAATASAVATLLN